MFAIFHAAIVFLVATLFDLYLFVLAVRMILASIRANYFNPLTQFAVKLTDGIVQPLRQIIPNIKNIELATIVLALGIEMIKFLLLIALNMGIWPNIIGLFVLSCADLTKMVIQIFFYAILLQALLSWLQAPSFLNQMLFQFTYPIMRPFQRWIPRVGGFDLSPIPALILLQLLSIIFVVPLINIGEQLVGGTT